jgi:hypothetical protein
MTGLDDIQAILSRAKKVAAIANDAGGAKQVVNMLSYFKLSPDFLFTGPAQKTLKDWDSGYSTISSLDELGQYNLIVTGSGWMTNLETEAIKFGHKFKVPVITVLDHWVNYKARFSNLGDEEIPRIFVTSNFLSASRARESFPYSQIVEIEDLELKALRKSLGEMNCESDLLIILEPFSEVNGYNEFQFDAKILGVVLAQIDNHPKLGKIILRLHPSSNVGFNLDQFEKNKIPVEISAGRSLLDDLKSTRYVVGFNSQAMYLSSQSGIPTYGYFKNFTGHWTNHFPEISPFGELGS